MKNNKMDNQQERQHLNIQYLKGWLAGIVDGEGCLQIALQRYRHGNKLHYRPQITICNTNIEMMEIVERILRVFRIGLYIQERFVDVQVAKGNKNKRPYRRITIYGFLRCKKFFESGIELIGKREQQKLMMEYINHRLSLKKGSPVTEKDEWYYNQMKILNKKHKGVVSPETIRQVGNKKSIVAKNSLKI